MSFLIGINNKFISVNGSLFAHDWNDAFIIQIDTTKGNGNNTFTLPLTNHATNINIKTSDGQNFNITNYTDIKKTIQFSLPGIYTIELRGQCGWSFNNTGDCLKLTGIISWGIFLFNYLYSGFFGCSNLGLGLGIPYYGSINAPNITTLYKLFSLCNLTNIGNGNIFKKCFKVISFISTFRINKISKIPNGLFDNNTLVKSFSSTFYINLITEIPLDLFKFNTKVTDFSGTFFTNLISEIPPRLFDNNTLVTTFYYTFYSNLITEIPIDLFKFNTKVTDFSGTFYINSINSITFGLFDNCPLVTTFYATFTRNNISEIPQTLFYNCTAVTNFEYTFNLNPLIDIPYRLFYNNKNVTLYTYCFKELKSQCTLPSEIFDTSVLYKVTNFDEMFFVSNTENSCLGIIQDIWNYASVTSSKTNCFFNCTGISNYDLIPNDWKGL